MTARIPDRHPGHEDRIANVVSLALSVAAAQAEVVALLDGKLSGDENRGGEADAATDRTINALEALVGEALALGRAFGLLPLEDDEPAKARHAAKLAVMWEATVLRDPLTEDQSADFAAFAGANWRYFMAGDHPDAGSPAEWDAIHRHWRVVHVARKAGAAEAAS